MEQFKTTVTIELPAANSCGAFTTCGGGGGGQSVQRRDQQSSSNHQVWPLTQFFLSPFLKKNHWFSFRANFWILIREILFSSIPPSNPLVSISDPWRGCGEYGALHVALNRLVDSCVASGTIEKLGHCQVCQARLDVPGHRQKQPTQTAFVEHTLFHRSLIVKSQQNKIELVTGPPSTDKQVPLPCHGN